MNGATELSWLGENWARIIVSLTSIVSASTIVAGYRVWRNGKSADLKVETDGDGQLRIHYAAELQSIRDQLTKSSAAHVQRAADAEARHREAMIAADERFNRAMLASDEREAACQAEVRLLRDEVRKLSEEIFGLRKNMGQSGRSAIVLAAQVPSLDIQTAADRAADALTDHDERLHALPHHEGTSTNGR